MVFTSHLAMAILWAFNRCFLASLIRHSVQGSASVLCRVRYVFIYPMPTPSKAVRFRVFGFRWDNGQSEGMLDSHVHLSSASVLGLFLTLDIGHPKETIRERGREGL